ncbi:MAG: carboxymuconolactone decarboxylase family protein [Spirochaetales bacterium]|nr:carboxymuconolactone decarboxylase family protein [Spirochaetales bacterium]
MQRYMLTEYEDAPQESKDVFDDYMRVTGDTKVPVWLKSMGHAPSLVRAYWERAKGTLFGGQLPLPLKEMIVFVVSGFHGAKYCTACHAQSVLKLDKALKFTDLKSFFDENSEFVMPDSYKAVVDFASIVACDANGVTDGDFQKLMDEGFGLEEICEIIAVIDLATMFNVYTSALKLHLDPDYQAII